MRNDKSAAIFARASIACRRLSRWLQLSTRTWCNFGGPSSRKNDSERNAETVDDREANESGQRPPQPRRIQGAGLIIRERRGDGGSRMRRDPERPGKFPDAVRIRRGEQNPEGGEKNGGQQQPARSEAALTRRHADEFWPDALQR